jgi:hypothetical protein
MQLVMDLLYTNVNYMYIILIICRISISITGASTYARARASY